MRWLLLAWGILACGRDRPSREVSGAGRPSLVGTWRAADFTNPSGRDSTARHPLGRPPRAYLVYDATGHVFFQMVNGVFATPELRGRWAQADSATLRALLGGAAAYFGTYDADYESGRVIHHIEGEIPPNLGTSEVATPFRLRGDSLQLGHDSTVHWLFLRARRAPHALPPDAR
jgi:hypothetical protein